MEVEIAKKIQRISSCDGLVVKASGLISSKRHLVQTARERKERHRKRRVDGKQAASDKAGT